MVVALAGVALIVATKYGNKDRGATNQFISWSEGVDSL